MSALFNCIIGVSIGLASAWLLSLPFDVQGLSLGQLLSIVIGSISLALVTDNVLFSKPSDHQW